MSLFGANTGFGSGTTGVFGSATTDSHNPMKVPNTNITFRYYKLMILIIIISLMIGC